MSSIIIIKRFWDSIIFEKFIKSLCLKDYWVPKLLPIFPCVTKVVKIRICKPKKQFSDHKFYFYPLGNENSITNLFKDKISRFSNHIFYSLSYYLFNKLFGNETIGEFKYFLWFIFWFPHKHYFLLTFYILFYFLFELYLKYS